MPRAREHHERRDRRKDRPLDVGAGAPLAHEDEPHLARQERRHRADERRVLLLGCEPPHGPDDERVGLDPELGPDAGARLGVGVELVERDAVGHDAKALLRDALLGPGDLRRLRRHGDDRVERPHDCAGRPEAAAAVLVRAVLGVHAAADAREQGRGHRVEHRRRVVRVHDVGPRPLEEVREAHDQQRIGAVSARRVEDGDARRVGAELAARRQRDDDGLVPARGELSRQRDHQALLPAEPQPLHDVDDAHSRACLTLHAACASSS